MESEDLIATPFQMFLAKVAGKKIVVVDSGVETTAYAYNDAIYIESQVQLKAGDTTDLADLLGDLLDE